jgi:hypothetical protein
MGVMLSVAKHLAFSVTHEDEIFRLLPHQEDVATQSVAGGFQTRPYTLFAVVPYGRPVLRQAQHPEPSRGPVAPTPFNPLLSAICHLAIRSVLPALCSLIATV